MKLTEYFNQISRTYFIVAAIISLVLLGYFDYYTGIEISFSVFYLIPIFLVAWPIGKRAGLIMAIACGITYYLADVMVKHEHTNVYYYYWNITGPFGFYIIFAYLLWTIKGVLEHEKELARTDSLTGAANGRAFLELINNEISRAQRYKHPFTLAYMDLDNFKLINDRFGHTAGDNILHQVVLSIKNAIRTSDVVARLGGDEFAILLPETGPEHAVDIIDRVHKELMKDIKKNDWDVTFSIGAAIFIIPSDSADESIKIADSLMYMAKAEGKNTVKCEVVIK